MSEAAVMVRGDSGAPAPILGLLRNHWPLVLGFAAMAIPTLIGLAQEVWPMEIGAHGPIVLATGAWLLFHIRGELLALASRPPLVLVGAAMVVGAALYAFGRPFDLISVEALGLYLFFLATAALLIGLRPMLANVFPFFYLAFLIPVPGWIIDQATAPLRVFVSQVSFTVLSWFGYPIAREGVVLYIAQYRLLVEDACSGMNSLIGLTAVMLFYIYIIHRASFRYALLLILMIIPIAVFVNIVRVMALILLTYYQGDAVAQGFLHGTTGVVLFAAALGLTILVDRILQSLLSRRSAQREHLARA